MIEKISHITFVVKDLDKTTTLYKELFDAKEVYASGEKAGNRSIMCKFPFQRGEARDPQFGCIPRGMIQMLGQC